LSPHVNGACGNIASMNVDAAHAADWTRSRPVIGSTRRSCIPLAFRIQSSAMSRLRESFIYLERSLQPLATSQRERDVYDLLSICNPTTILETLRWMRPSSLKS
jgi:hypothetical protein